MSFINELIALSLPVLPKWFARPFAKPYVAGETSEEALKHVEIINKQGFSATIDILGEHVTDIHEAQYITEQYCGLYGQINHHSLDCNLSIKPTHLGLSISLEEALANITKLLNQARKYNSFLRLDMENSYYTDQTFEIYNYCKRNYEHVGVAIQSYLYRSLKDIEIMSDDDFNARICKGIYKEEKTIVLQDREEIKENFLTLAKTMEVNGAYAAYATHDQDLIDELLAWIESETIDPNIFEFQVLYGVPMEGRLEELIEKGYKVRIYVPFGPDWFDYSLRRLKENPDIARYVINNMFKH